jgi:hypothetical protein
MPFDKLVHHIVETPPLPACTTLLTPPPQSKWTVGNVCYYVRSQPFASHVIAPPQKQSNNHFGKGSPLLRLGSPGKGQDQSVGVVW